MPNSEQVKSIVRWVLTTLFAGALGAWLVAHGIPIPGEDTLTLLVSLIVGAGSLAWGIFNKTKANQVEAAANIVPIPAAVQRSAGVTEPVPMSKAEVQPDAGPTTGLGTTPPRTGF